MEQPLVSVIVPVYRVEAYLEECVESILGQTYTNLEVWLVDDGSPDNCPVLCDAFAQRDPRVRVIHKANGGVSSARNAALDVCTGEYITFVDSDDAIHPQAVERLLAACLEAEADMAMGELRSLEENGALRPENPADRLNREVFGPEEAFRRMTVEHEIYFSIVWGKLYRRAVFTELRFSVGRLHEDEMIQHRLCGACGRIAAVGEPVYHYRTRGGSISQSAFTIRRMEDLAAAYWDRYLYLKERGYPRYARDALHKCCGALNTGLTRLPLKGNEAVFHSWMKRVLRHHAGLRCGKLLLLAGKNRLTMR